MERYGGRTARLTAAMILMGLALALLAACSGASSAAQASATNTPTAVRNLTPGAGSPTPGLTPIGGGGGTQGSSDLCSQAVSKTADLPASIPAYPNGELRIAQSSGGIGFFGVCSPDSVTTIAQFYSAQLPTKGWSQMDTSQIDGVELITAMKGNASISVAIRTESSGQTDIVIQTNGL